MGWPSGSLGFTGDCATYHTLLAPKWHYVDSRLSVFLRKDFPQQGQCANFVTSRKSSTSTLRPMHVFAGSTPDRRPGGLSSAGRELSFLFRIGSRTSSSPLSSARRPHRRLPLVWPCNLYNVWVRF